MLFHPLQEGNNLLKEGDRKFFQVNFPSRLLSGIFKRRNVAVLLHNPPGKDGRTLRYCKAGPGFNLAPYFLLGRPILSYLFIDPPFVAYSC